MTLARDPALRAPHSAFVLAVAPDSAAAQAGVGPGDRLLAVNGVVPRDIIDLRLDATGERVEVDLERAGRRMMLVVEKDPDEDLGIEFESPVFDRLKTCNNACDFCFVRALPPGLRRSLYIKDDDFRYSFLYGNFTTLTNLTDAEWRRLLFQRLSPLRVSVHATDPTLRRALLANPRAPAILEQLDQLGAHGIEVHAQIVLMPGRNDGPALERTIADLATRHPTVASAAVVPVGLTAYSKVQHTRPLTARDAEVAIDLVEAHQRRYRRQLGPGFVYASDELYLLAGRPLPGVRSYDGYPQLENGVGLVQLLRDGWKRALRRLPAAVDSPLHVCWMTGALMAPILRDLAADLRVVDGLAVDVVAMENSLFGGQVSVAGLVPGKDVVAALRGRRYDRVVLPRSMFDIAGRQTIDSCTTEDIAAAVGMDVVVAESPRQLVDLTLAPPRKGAGGTAAEHALTPALSQRERGPGAAPLPLGEAGQSPALAGRGRVRASPSAGHQNHRDPAKVLGPVSTQPPELVCAAS